MPARARSLDPLTTWVRAPRQHLQRRLLAALHPHGVLRPAAARPAARAARAAALDALSRSSFWSSLCLVVGIVPALTVGPVPARPRSLSVLGTATPYYSLALWHGVNAPLVMSLVALAAGAALYCAPGQLARARARGAAGAPPAQGPAHLRAHPGRRSAWRWPRGALPAGRDRAAADAAPHPRAGRLRGGAPGCCWGSGLLRAGVLARRASIRSSRWSGWSAPPAPSARPGRPSTTASPRWLLLGGAGVVTCVTFVWFSAPDLAVTQLAGRDRDHGAAAPRPALAAEAAARRSPRDAELPRPAAPRPRPRHRRGLRRRDRRDLICGDDPAARPRGRRPTSSSTPMPRAAAPTWST